MKIEFSQLGSIESFNRDMKEESFYPGNDPDRPRFIDLKAIDNMEFEDVHWDDYPDFSDAFIVSADMDGIPMSEAELDKLNDGHPEFVYEKLFERLF